MLDLLEKIAVGFCVCSLLATVCVYLFLGTPSTTSAEFVPSVEKRPATPQAPKGADAPIPPDEKVIIDALAQQGRKLLPGQRLPRDEYRMPEKTLERLSTEANWLPELKRAQSTKIQVGDKTTRLKIFDIEEGSMLEKLGIKENDVIELVDGQIVEFTETNAAKYLDIFKNSVKKLRQGESVSVTVTRNNQPLHIEFKL